jgi:hypothetical protein
MVQAILCRHTKLSNVIPLYDNLSYCIIESSTQEIEKNMHNKAQLVH